MKIKNLSTLSYVSLLDFSGRNHRFIYDNSTHVDKAIQWLCVAQDCSGAGGVSEGYHLFHGWLPPYPETTGYIIESFFDYFHYSGNMKFKERAIRMADWLLSIQNDDGSIPDSYMKRSMVFDTGQVVFGFVRCYEETGIRKYKIGAEKAGEWLLRTQRDDGAWEKFSVDGMPHAYYSRVAWSLLRLHKITSDNRYVDSCIKNIEWCLKQQQGNGWFDKASFNLKNHDGPFTHTIAYTIDGILESGIYLQEQKYIFSAVRAVDGVMEHMSKTGYLCGTYGKDWSGDGRFSCLTGSAQLAINMFRLYSITKNNKYFLAGKMVNVYLKRKQELRVETPNIYGAIAGSYPIWGRYIHFTYPNWAAKFFIDSLMLEDRLSKA